jgi:HSP20 family molecular chaperone IbpA
MSTNQSQASSPLGWVGQLLGEDFWDQIQSAVNVPGQQNARGPSRSPPNERPAVESATLPGPPADVYVTSLHVVVCMAVPGLTGPEQVSLRLGSPTVLAIEVFIPPTGTVGTNLRQERFVGYSARTIQLPVPVSATGVTAKYIDGLVEFKLPRVDPGSANGEVAVLHVSS